MELYHNNRLNYSKIKNKSGIKLELIPILCRETYLWRIKKKTRDHSPFDIRFYISVKSVGVEENPAVLIINRIDGIRVQVICSTPSPIVVVAKRRFLINVLTYTLALFPPVIAVTDALITSETKTGQKSWWNRGAKLRRDFRRIVESARVV